MEKVSAPRKVFPVPVIQFWLGLVSVFTGTAASPLRPHPGNKAPVDKPLDRGTFLKKGKRFLGLPPIGCSKPSMRNEKEMRV
jgi:hypothetical protein